MAAAQTRIESHKGRDNSASIAMATSWQPQRQQLVQKIPKLVQNIVVASIPAVLTLVLIYLLIVRFDRSPVPPCRHGASPSVMYSVCGFPSWNPSDLVVIPSMSLLLSIRSRPKIVTSPDERDSQVGLFILLLDSSQPHKPPVWHMPQLIWPVNRASDVGRMIPGLNACREPPSKTSFNPHAIASYPISNSSVRVFVLASSVYREAVEWFDLVQTPKGPVMSWVGCTPLSNGLIGNRIYAINDDSFFVSMSQPVYYGWGGLKPLFTLFIGLVIGYPTGDIRLWQLQYSNWTVVPQTEAILPSGIVAFREYLYFSELGKQKICRVPNPLFASDSTRNKTCIRVNGFPDNLSLAKNKILFSCHQDYWAVWLCLISGHRSCPTPFSVNEIPLRNTKVKELLVHDGSAIGAVTTVVEFSGTLYFGSLLSDRIGFWHLP